MEDGGALGETVEEFLEVVGLGDSLPAGKHPGRTAGKPDLRGDFRFLGQRVDLRFENIDVLTVFDGKAENGGFDRVFFEGGGHLQNPLVDGQFDGDRDPLEAKLSRPSHNLVEGGGNSNSACA